jgi:hypothetical protein
MNLYVPEIGDELVLTEDWSFDLHAENRNMSLAQSLGYYLHRHSKEYKSGWLNESEFPKMRKEDFKVIYPTQEELHAKCKKLFSYDYDLENKLIREAQNNCPEFLQYCKDLNEWTEKADKTMVTSIPVTLQAGQILKIDRIYIRKGSSDYSSLTFYAKSLAPVTYASNRWSNATKKAIRFWAKLLDCNNIKFEKNDN